MNEQWDRIWKSFEEADTALEGFIESGLTSQVVKKMQGFVKTWNGLKKMASEFDKYMAPVESIEMELPWQTVFFAEKWQFWKDYLLEQHGQAMKSRSEKMALEYLANLSDSSEEEACRIIDFSCYCRAKSFVVPPKSKEYNNQLIKSDDGTWG